MQTQLDWLFSTQLFGIKLGLEGITKLLHDSGATPLHTGAQLIHVAGTNGKGSTCAMIERIAREAGYKTGLFTSPHLISFHERIRVNGEMISDSKLEQYIERLRQVVETWEHKPTFFEFACAIALLHFKEEGCQLILLETGMGGRLDASNALPKDLAIITPIAMDHCQYLGDSLRAIAQEKAGIIQAKTPLICAMQEAEAMGVIQERCKELESPLHIVEQACLLDIGLRGGHQRMNAAVALAALDALEGFPKDEDIRLKGLGAVQWQARFEYIAQENGKKFILDGAHNEHAMKALTAAWREEYGEARAQCLFAAAADKDIGAVLEELAPLVKEWILAPLTSPRLMSVEQSVEKIRKWSEAPIKQCQELKEALQAFEEGGTGLACGSLFLAGEIKALMEQQSYRRTAQ